MKRVDEPFLLYPCFTAYFDGLEKAILLSYLIHLDKNRQPYQPRYGPKWTVCYAEELQFLGFPVKEQAKYILELRNKGYIIAFTDQDEGDWKSSDITSDTIWHIALNKEQICGMIDFYGEKGAEEIRTS